MSNEIRSMDEYKTMHALCTKFYYQNIFDEGRDKLPAKQRVRNRERYQTDPEYREKVKTYMKGYNERKKAAQRQSTQPWWRQNVRVCLPKNFKFAIKQKLLKGILPIYNSKNGRKAGYRSIN
jgi:hypothetical protein